MSRDLPSLRSRFPAAYVLATRWADNDVYGHINNAAYYGLIDTAVNRFMIARAGIDIHAGPLIALVVETGCRYHSALEFPQDIEVALRVERIGRTSVTWNAGLFAAPAAPDDPAAADAHFIHVLVDRNTRRPAPWPDAMRDALAEMIG
ncbi:thioesterase family protein [Acuticoccus sp. MNP-M23]|uniref:acyl-CoA thioesterase n=1 Tax=Acuticoccus sp. MNP-M23 TaxID=3072793 RepID=UPI0028150947|nr:thioesterase family protein [Acuticoccus sp. MNP-M23]WMS43696.1 thioesterase family protein [Acuticoccus sp. MNP-M23]